MKTSYKNVKSCTQWNIPPNNKKYKGKKKKHIGALHIVKKVMQQIHAYQAIYVLYI